MDELKWCIDLRTISAAAASAAFADANSSCGSASGGLPSGWLNHRTTPAIADFFRRTSTGEGGSAGEAGELLSTASAGDDGVRGPWSTPNSGWDETATLVR